MRFFLCLLLLIYTFYVKSDTTPCTTPTGEKGECVFIDSCPILLKTLVNSTHNATQTTRPLKEFSCNGRYDYVCCNETRSFAAYGVELSDKEFCGFQHSDDYYSDKNTTSIDEFPWLAAIMGNHLMTNEEKIICHGSLINPRYVLTVAQCFVGLYIRTYNISRVLLGEYHLKTENDCVELPRYGITECNKAEEFSIARKILHPFFNARNGLNDIALLKLNRTALYSDYIRPICLPIKGTVFANHGDILYTTGWSSTPYFDGESEVVKKKIQTSLIPYLECRDSYTVIKIPSIGHVFCTVDPKNNTEFSCAGDAGAPVMFNNRLQWHLEGIVSRGGRCAEGYPGIHTRVSSYLEWIKLNIEPIVY